MIQDQLNRFFLIKLLNYEVHASLLSVVVNLVGELCIQSLVFIIIKIIIVFIYLLMEVREAEFATVAV